MADEHASAETNRDILSHIHELIETEHRLRSSVGGEAGTDHHELADVEHQLDQCWDLLRQRRARQEFAQDPASAEVRPVSEVEGYQQ